MKSMEKQLKDAFIQVKDHDTLMTTNEWLREEIAHMKEYQEELMNHHQEEKQWFEHEIDELKEDKC